MKKVILFALCVFMVAGVAFAQTAEKSVARYVFTTGIADREPINDVSSFSIAGNDTLYFFAELANMQNTTATYVWSKNGEEIFKLPVNIGGPRWRASSSMKAGHFKAGDIIKVQVTGDDGIVYAEKEVTIQ